MRSTITADERYTLSLLRRLGLSSADIARALFRLAAMPAGGSSLRAASDHCGAGHGDWAISIGPKLRAAVSSRPTRP
ncbi:MAG: hypothetical protein ABJC74_11390 [Gemmatimonadota bacterium]